MARWSSGLTARLAGRLNCHRRFGEQGWHGLTETHASVYRSGCLGRRYLVSFSTVLENADNVVPAYAMIAQQLQAEVTEEPRRDADVRAFRHGISWSWNGKEIATEGAASSKKAAKNEAARQVLKKLLDEEPPLMDPTKNAMLAQWAIQWLNRRLDASMEIQEELPAPPEESVSEHSEEGPKPLPQGDDFFGGETEVSHTCSWSCPQVPGETAVRGSARTVAESRRQLMVALYEALPPSLDDIIKSLPPKETRGKQRSPPKEANLSKVNAMHNEVCQQLGVKTKREISAVAPGEFKCKLQWSFYDDVQMAQRTEEVIAVGRTKIVARGLAHEMMLIKQGHLPDLDDEFHRETAEIAESLSQGLVQQAVSQSIATMERTAPNGVGWTFFLPDVLRAVLAENDYGGSTDILSTVQRCLHEEGVPLCLWEELLDVASYSIRHYRLSMSALQQLAGFPLADSSFPGEPEKQYFAKFRNLLAMERHGGLLHGIQQYELDPRMFCSVPLVDVHAMEADKVVLTSIPEAGVQDIAEGVRPLRSSDLVLFVPLEVLGDLRGPASSIPGSFEDDLHQSANWQHPEVWLASVTNVKGNARFGEEVRVHTRRISRFGSDVHNAAEGEQPAQVAPIAVGRQYRLFLIALETPTARMLSALRCLCRVRLPAWSDNYEGRRPSYNFSEDLRQILVGAPAEAVEQAGQPARIARGTASTEEIMDMMTGSSQAQFANLTPTQREAMRRAMDDKLSLIQGPPGTGKTHVACAIVAAWTRRYGPLGERILAVADSNVAADNMYIRLEALGVQCVRVGQGKEVGSTMTGDMLWQAVKTAQVVIATCIGSGMEMLESRGTAKHFQRVLIDECTQACEPAALVSLGRSCEQTVLVGDHNQLPATVLSKAAKYEGLGVSLFERMVLTNGVSPTLLIEQRRMHSSIAEFPNITFYKSQLVNAVEDASLQPVPGFPWPNPDCRVCFVDVSGAESKRGYSTYNSAEAEAVADVLQGMFDAGFPPQDLCVLTAYLAQRDEIRRAISERRRVHAADLSIDTIDGYQGMERDVVLFSAARSNVERTLGFLADERRMNVMLTRARRGLIIFGHGEHLRHSMDTGSRWREWIEWVESKGAVLSVADVVESQVLSQSKESASLSSPAFGGSSAPFSSPAFGGSAAPFADQAATGFGFPQGGSSATPSSHGGFPQGGSSEPLPAAAPPPPPLKSDWEKVYSEQYGRHYYWNTATNQTQWEPPPGM